MLNRFIGFIGFIRSPVVTTQVVELQVVKFGSA
jgi:hypothetical protein